MVIRDLSTIVKNMYENGLKDEYFVMDAVSHTLGGDCKKSTQKEDRLNHIDFWWDSRNDTFADDTIHWVEIQSVNGNKGWIYGDATYIAFRTFSQIIFVKNTVLQKISEDVLKKELVFRNPKECYIPYQRWGRKDIVYKIPTIDLINMSDFIIDCKKET